MANHKSFYSDYYVSTGSHANAYFEDNEGGYDQERQQTIGGATDIIGNYQGNNDPMFQESHYARTQKSGNISNPEINPGRGTANLNNNVGMRESMFYESDVNFNQQYQNKRITTHTIGGATAILNDYDYSTEVGNDYASAVRNDDVEKQTANLTYLGSAAPLYDPYQSNSAGTISANHKMMQPHFVEYNNIHQNETQPQWAQNTLKADRIEVLKREIKDLNAVETPRKKKSHRCCYCCPQTRMGLIICVVSILLVLLLVGFLIWFFFPT